MPESDHYSNVDAFHSTIKILLNVDIDIRVFMLLFFVEILNHYYY